MLIKVNEDEQGVTYNFGSDSEHLGKIYGSLGDIMLKYYSSAEKMRTMKRQLTKILDLAEVTVKSQRKARFKRRIYSNF
jgi:hypothetical protein